ncbi:hypothetical protein [Nonomuraea aurantiaca]|uniref:hypothetical protein n=1 Tax=Nonomuraea aurantiaca TaxID=2878562 RepID=UPI001CD9C9A9|nr:hypothetical protein [Nonomuraea aurantiaca]MCA2223136.1 hypothetical protein [Nonomuraea aurantiaca]
MAPAWRYCSPATPPGHFTFLLGDAFGTAADKEKKENNFIQIDDTRSEPRHAAAGIAELACDVPLEAAPELENGFEA